MNAVVQSSNRRLVQTEQNHSSEKLQYLTFLLDDELFAIGILAVKEIIEYGGLTVVPMMPSSVRGVINLRGAVVPVIDLSARFGKPSKETTKRTCIIIAEIESEGARQDIGIIVDTVNEVLDLPSSDIEPAPTFGAKIRTDFIQGMGKVEGKFIILLNINAVLATEEISALIDASVRAGDLVANGTE